MSPKPNKGHTGLDMYHFDYELNWAIKWVIKAFIFYGKLVDTFNKFPFEYLLQVLHLGWWRMSPSTSAANFKLAFRQLITTLEPSNFNFYVLKLLFEHYWVEWMLKS